MEHNDELYLKQTVGNRNPFRVPEGYFEQFAEQVMQQLPDREQPVAQQQPLHATLRPSGQRSSLSRARRVQMRPWFYAAACTALALMLGVSYYFMQPQTTSVDPAPIAAAPAASATYAASDNSYIDDMADYVMLDNTEIYACLSEY